MARDPDEEDLPAADSIRRRAGRTAANWTAVMLSLGVIAAWAYTGLYQLEPGEAGVILRLGKYTRTVTEPGLKWHLPQPIEEVSRINATELRREKFGLGESGSMKPGEETATFENAIQTSDSNIVNLSYEVQYTVDDAYAFLYGMAEPQRTLRDAAQSAVREVVGRTSVNGVLSEERARIEREARTTLQEILRSYFAREGMESGFEIDAINLNIVQPPHPVQEAFDDVIAAQQDGVRAIFQARGDAREILERAKAEATELEEAAAGYKEAKILEAAGEAQRFVSLQREYALAPEVTRRRLYLETMEQVLPTVDKVIVEPDTVTMFPVLPLPRAASPTPARAEE
ncbi:MAG: FtsH protease activity modulator HflK [Proteobacteria bacterium]|nr:FtsH protease activity modulator HflK [Pseudomonadota bacterium]